MEIIETLIKLLPTVILSGVGVSVVTELLKLEAIPVPAQKFPRTTAFILSIVSAIISLISAGLTIAHDIFGLIAQVVFTLLISMVFYNTILKKIKDRKQIK